MLIIKPQEFLRKLIIAGEGMPIISISMDEETLSELGKMEKSLGFSGRSEALRAGVRSLLSENRSAEKLSGRVKAVLLLVHDEKAEARASELKHEYGDIVSTQIHSHLKGEKCLEVFILDGDAPRIKSMYKAAQSSRKMEYAKIVVP